MAQSLHRTPSELIDGINRLDGGGHSAGLAGLAGGDDTVVSDYTALISGSWNVHFGSPVFVTYSFETAPSAYLAADGFSQTFTDTFQAFTASEEANARAALAQWGQASGITFLEAPTGEGDIKFEKYDFNTDPSVSDAAGFSYIPYFDLNAQGYNDDPLWGDVFINTTNSPGSADDATLFYLLHEIGHAIGFKHPFDDEPILIKSLDNTSHTVMSYTGGVVGQLGDLDLAAALFAYGPDSLDGTEVPQWSWSATTHTLTQTGGAGDDVIRGVSAEDLINGGDGNNIIYSGAGNDTLNQSLGHDTIFAGDGNDRLNMTGGTEVFDAGDGNDTVLMTGGSGTLHGGGGNDAIVETSAGADPIQIFGDDGNDTLQAGSGADSIDGGAGDDVLTVGTNATAINGGNGNDLIHAGDGAKSILDLVGGNDTIIAGANAGTINAYSGNDDITTGANAASISGGDGDDSIVAGANSVIIYGGSGDDTIIAARGVHAISGLDGNDSITAFAGVTLDAGTGENIVHIDLSGASAGTVTHVGGLGGQTRFYIDGPTSGLVIGDNPYSSDTVFSAFSIDLRYHVGGLDIGLTGALGANATGSAAANTITGNTAANILSGLGGSDTLDGGGGHDTLDGGDGTDYVSYASSGHGVTAHLGDATTQGSDSNGAIFASIEGLIGSAFADTLSGAAGNDILIGGAGADQFDGDSGKDTVSYADSTKAVSVNLTTGHGTGGTADGDLYHAIEGVVGSLYNDTLIGTSGDDTLTDGPSVYENGYDRMVGGAGNDAYYVYTTSNAYYNAGDMVLETVGGGSDTVYVGHAFILTAGSSVEVLQGISAAYGTVYLTGNELAQTLIGTSGGDVLDGGGGADTLAGGGGNDTYTVHSQADHVVETGNGGQDDVEAMTSYTLESGQSVEYLEVAADHGLRLQGNELAQDIVGSLHGDDTLLGGGGADTMSGGGGNDVYIVDNAQVFVSDPIGFGSDTVFASVSYALAPGRSIDWLATASGAGTKAENLTGNDLAQTINGNDGVNGLVGGAGSDTIFGQGGDDRIFGGVGRDVINPGGGNDVVAYAGLVDSTGLTRDLVQGMNLAGVDRFQFTVKPTAIDAAVTHGALGSAQFDQDLAGAVGSAQLGAHHAVLFTPDSGDLHQAGHVYLVVDANGVAGYQAGQDYVVELVNMTGTLTVSDFV